MIRMEDARDIIDNVITELKTGRIVIVDIPGENTFFNCVDSKSIIKAIIKERNLPIIVFNSMILSKETKTKLAHVLVFVRIRELAP